jgi:hypothetical protein
MPRLFAQPKTAVASPLFWFTATEFLDGGNDPAAVPLYLTRPEIILKFIWLIPVDDALHSLGDL